MLQYTVCDDSSKVNERPGSSTAIPRPDSARSTGSNYSSSSSLMPQLPYRVEDVEPISPPSKSLHLIPTNPALLNAQLNGTVVIVIFFVLLYR